MEWLHADAHRTVANVEILLTSSRMYFSEHSSHLVVVVLQDPICRPLLLDDHCCALPSLQVLAEIDRMCELLSLPTL